MRSLRVRSLDASQRIAAGSLGIQTRDTDHQEIYNITNYGEAQTEPLRTNRLNGAYSLVFTRGGPPPALDTSWLGAMGLKGFVGAEGRGRVTGVGIDGQDGRYAYTVGLANAVAQYWAPAAAGSGYYNLPGVLPGTYTLSIYKNELSVHTQSVTVAAGGTVVLNTMGVDDPSRVTPIWRIGDWDGSPNGFVNADKITSMHPSDPRMASWATGTYVVGSSSAAKAFPSYQWKDVNNPITIEFTLSAAQLAARTLRVGITAAFSGGRPQATVDRWASPPPAPSTQPDTRTLTVGTYRGNNAVYAFNVPAGAFVEGKNTLTLTVISGLGGAKFLSAGIAYDSVDLY